MKSIIQKLNDQKNRKYGQVKKKIVTSLNLNYPSMMSGSDIRGLDNDSNNSSPTKDGGNFDQLRTQLPEFEPKSVVKYQSHRSIEAKTSLSPANGKLP